MVDPSSVRDRAFGTLFLGDAYLKSGDIEEAASAIGDGADLAGRNRSGRLAEQLAPPV